MRPWITLGVLFLTLAVAGGCSGEPRTPEKSGPKTLQVDVVIDIDPMNDEINACDATGNCGQGTDSVVRSDLVTADYSLCIGNRELSQLIVVTLQGAKFYWNIIEQSAPLGQSVPLTFSVGGTEITTTCNYQVKGDCAGAGLPGQLWGKLPVKGILATYKDNGLPSVTNESVRLVHPRTATDRPCDPILEPTE